MIQWRRKRLLAASLVVIMLTASLASCGGHGDAQDTTAAGIETTAAPETTSEYDADGYLRSSLPDDLDYGNEVFNVLAREITLPEYDVEAQTGDVVQDAVWKRNLIVEEQLGVTLNYTLIPGSGGDHAEFSQYVINNILSESQSFDLIASYPKATSTLVFGGYLTNLMDVEYLDFEKPWWPASLIEELLIKNKLYVCAGDLTTTMLYNMSFIVYNNDLGEKYGLENPQQMALDGNWTLDVMQTYIKGVYSDLDGDGRKSAHDQYGLYSLGHVGLDKFYTGSGMSYIDINADGDLVISKDFFSDKSLALVDLLNTMYYNTNDAFFTTATTTDSLRMEGRSLMYDIYGSQLTTNICYGDFSYCILPTPKYDDKQESYCTVNRFGHNTYSIPMNPRDESMSGAVLEALCAAAYRTTTPALFESGYKYRYSKNPLDAETFELIRSSIVFERCNLLFFERMGGDSNSPVRIWRNVIIDNNNRLASFAKMFEKPWNKLLTEISEDFEK